MGLEISKLSFWTQQDTKVEAAVMPQPAWLPEGDKTRQGPYHGRQWGNSPPHCIYSPVSLRDQHKASNSNKKQQQQRSFPFQWNSRVPRSPHFNWLLPKHAILPYSPASPSWNASCWFSHLGPVLCQWPGDLSLTSTTQSSLPSGTGLLPIIMKKFWSWHFNSATLIL